MLGQLKSFPDSQMTYSGIIYKTQGFSNTGARSLLSMEPL